MRFSQFAYSFVALACVVVTPAHAQTRGAGPQGAPPTAPGHATPSTAKPTTPGTATDSTKSGASTSTTLNPIAAEITARPQLEAKVTALLPSGMTLNQASTGFKNQGQFIAALHVARNLDCGATCFSQLQVDMTQKGMSLGQAIQAVTHSSASTARRRADTAEREADDDLKAESTTTRTSTGPLGARKPAATKSREEIGVDFGGR